MRNFSLILPLAVAGVLALVAACTGPSRQSRGWQTQLGPVPQGPVTPVQMLREVNLQQAFIAPGRAGRYMYRPMQPRYITIHATENPDGDAWAHAKALRNGALRATKRVGGNRIGFLTWHFTVQGNLAVQHLPTNEQGEHADFDGVGNNYSIGIEMCEHRGNNIAKTIENTAKLAAFLCYSRGISPSNVVPHYHWPRYGTSPLHKDCPHFLLDNKRPGPTWNWFLSRVRAHYSRLVPGATPRI